MSQEKDTEGGLKVTLHPIKRQQARCPPWEFSIPGQLDRIGGGGRTREVGRQRGKIF